MKIRAEYLTVIALVALGSCSSPTSGPDPDTPASVEVTPSAALMVSIGDTVDFSATVRNGTAQPIGAAVGWASSAPAVVTIDLGTIEYAPSSGDQDEEFIEVFNPNGFAVDISGWRVVGGAEHRFEGGTVIRPYNSVYTSPNVVALFTWAA